MLKLLEMNDIIFMCFMIWKKKVRGFYLNIDKIIFFLFIFIVFNKEERKGCYKI